MHAEFNVIRATVGDLEDLVHLFNAYRIFYKQSGDLEGARIFLRERITKDESVIFIAREATGDAVGFTQLYPSFSSASMQRLWVLNDLYVAENRRRRGIAAGLLDAARNFSERDSAKGLLLCTQTTNTKAQALYRKNGYVQMDDFHWYFLKT